MKITYIQTASGGSQIELVGGSGADDVLDFSVTPLKNVDIVSFLRSAYLKAFDWGNVGHRIAWKVDREHANKGAAERYACTAHVNTPSGPGFLKVEPADGGTPLYLHDAVVLGPVPTYFGLATATQWTVVGGRFDGTNPKTS